MFGIWISIYHIMSEKNSTKSDSLGIALLILVILSLVVNIEFTTDYQSKTRYKIIWTIHGHISKISNKSGIVPLSVLALLGGLVMETYLSQLYLFRQSELSMAFSRWLSGHGTFSVYPPPSLARTSISP